MECISRKFRLLFILPLLLTGIHFAWSGTQDTVDDVQAAGREGTQDTADIKVTIDEMNAFISTLNSNPSYLASFFDAANKGDQAAVLNLVRQKIAISRASVRELTITHSFFLVLNVTSSKGKQFGLCISTDKVKKCGNGKAFDIGPLN